MESTADYNWQTIAGRLILTVLIKNGDILSIIAWFDLKGY